MSLPLRKDQTAPAETDKPAILPPDDIYRARCAFLRFQHALDSLEQEMKPLEMSQECAFELKMIGSVSRSFFKMANVELFKKVEVSR